MRVYLVSGESYLLVNDKINEIVGENTNVTIFDLSQTSLQDVIVEAGYVSMFQEEKFIIARNANFFAGDKLSEDDTNLLISYLEQPNPQSSLIFVCPQKLDTRKKITKLIKDKHECIVIPNLKYYEIENRIMSLFKKQGFKIGEDTVKYIVANSLNNYDIAYMEAEKIMLFYNEPTSVSLEHVKNIVAKSINTNNFLFVDAIVDNNLELSLELLKDLKIMKVEPTVLFTLIARDFRIMIQVKTLLESGKSEYAIMSELGLQDWQLEKYIKKTFPYKIKELESILVKISDIDLAIKSGKIDKFMALETFILDICE